MTCDECKHFEPYYGIGLETFGCCTLQDVDGFAKFGISCDLKDKITQKWLQAKKQYEKEMIQFYTRE
jgi:hypothetical protein